MAVKNLGTSRIYNKAFAERGREDVVMWDDQFAPSMDLWVDTAPPEVVAHCMTADGNLSVYNIWDSGRGRGRESQAHSSGMLVEDLPDGRRYRCNDIGFDTNFDKLVFRIMFERGCDPREAARN